MNSDIRFREHFLEQVTHTQSQDISEPQPQDKKLKYKIRFWNLVYSEGICISHNERKE